MPWNIVFLLTNQWRIYWNFCEKKVQKKFPFGNFYQIPLYPVSQHTWEVCGQELQGKRTFPNPQGNWWSVKKHNKLHVSCFSYFSCYWSVSYTDHPSELIQTNTEPLRSKRIFTELSILKGAIFVKTYLFYLIYIHLLNVTSLIYGAKVLSNWHCQIIRILLLQ